MSYLLDTNVVSEVGRPQPEPKVIAWLGPIDPDSLFLSVLTLGELTKGVLQLERRNPGAGAPLRAWLDLLRSDYQGRILGIDGVIAETWGRLAAIRPRPVVDGLLAATAIVHELTLVTRNARDFEGTGVAIHDPWSMP